MLVLFVVSALVWHHTYAVCTVDTDCPPNQYCDAPFSTLCLPVRAPGLSCTRGAECGSGQCSTTSLCTCNADYGPTPGACPPNLPHCGIPLASPPVLDTCYAYVGEACVRNADCASLLCDPASARCHCLNSANCAEEFGGARPFCIHGFCVASLPTE